jgi:hypothetical protein
MRTCFKHDDLDCPLCLPQTIQDHNYIMRYFDYQHLPEGLKEVSRMVYDLAVAMNSLLPNGAEKSAGFRKLLEAKDCFVRAVIK